MDDGAEGTFGEDSLKRIEDVFRSYDKDGSGHIDVTEFGQAMSELGYNLDKEQLDQIVEQLDVDGDGFVDIAEFIRGMGSFLVGKIEQDEVSDFEPDEVAYSESQRQELRKIYEMVDTDNSGSVDKEELLALLRQMGDVEVDEDTIETAFAHIAAQGGGKDMDFEMFVKELGPMLLHKHEDEEKAGGPVQFTAEHERRLKEIFDQFDADGSGSIDAKELGLAIEMALGKKLEGEELDHVMHQLDEDGNGNISFEEFALGLGDMFVQALDVPKKSKAELLRIKVAREVLAEDKIKAMESAWKHHAEKGPDGQDMVMADNIKHLFHTAGKDVDRSELRNITKGLTGEMMKWDDFLVAMAGLEERKGDARGGTGRPGATGDDGNDYNIEHFSEKAMERIQDLTAEKEKVSAELQKLAMEHKILKTNAKDTAAQCVNLQEEIYRKEDEIEKQKAAAATLPGLIREKNQLLDEIAHKDESVKSLQEEIKRSFANTQYLRDAQLENITTIKNLQNLLAQAESDLNDARDELSLMKDAGKASEELKNMAQLKKENKALKVQVADLEGWEKKGKRAEESVEKLIQKLASLQQELNELKDNVGVGGSGRKGADMAKEFDSMGEDYNDPRKHEIEQLKMQLAAEKKKQQDLEQLNAALNEQGKKDTTEIEFLRKRLSQYEDRAGNALSQAERTKETFGALGEQMQEEIATLKAQLARARGAAGGGEDLDTQIAKLTDKITFLERENAELKKTVEEQKGKLKTMKAKLDSGGDYLGDIAVQQENQQLQEKLRKLEEELKAARGGAAPAPVAVADPEALKKLEEEKAALEAKVKELDDLNSKMKEKLTADKDKKEQMKKMIVDLQARVKELDQKNTELNARLASGAAGSSETSAKLQTEIDALKRSCEEKDATIAELNDTKKKLMEKIKGDQEKKAQYKEKLQALTDKHEKLKAKAKELDDNRAKLVEKVKEEKEKRVQQKFQLTVLQSKADKAEADLKTKTAELEEVQPQVTKLKDEVATTTTMLTTEKDARATSDRRVVELEETIRQKEEELKRYKEEAASSGDAAMRAKEAEIQRLQKALDEATADVRAKDAALAGRDAELATLKAELAKLQKSESALQQEVASLKAELAALQEQLQAAKKAEARIEEEVTKQKHEVVRLTKELEEAQSELTKGHADSEGTMKRLTEELNKLKADHSSLTVEHTARTTELKKLTEDHASLTAERAKLTTQHATLITEHTTLKDDMAKTVAANKDEIERSKTEIVRLTTELKKVQEELAKGASDSEGAYKRLVEEHAKLKEEKTQVVTMHDKLKDEHTKCDKVLEKLQTEHTTVVKEFTVVKTELANLKQEDAMKEQMMKEWETKASKAQAEVSERDKEIKALKEELAARDAKVEAAKQETVKQEQIVMLTKKRVEEQQVIVVNRDGEIAELKAEIDRLKAEIEALRAQLAQAAKAPPPAAAPAPTPTPRPAKLSAAELKTFIKRKEMEMKETTQVIQRLNQKLDAAMGDPIRMKVACKEAQDILRSAFKIFDSILETVTAEDKIKQIAQLREGLERRKTELEKEYADIVKNPENTDALERLRVTLAQLSDTMEMAQTEGTGYGVNLQLREIVQKVPLFNGCSDVGFFNELVRKMKEQQFKPGEFVVTFGEEGASMYFVTKGKVDVLSKDGTRLMGMDEGAFFGEIAVLLKGKRTASIKAITYVEAFELHKSALLAALQHYPQYRGPIIQVGEDRLVNDRKKARKAAQSVKIADHPCHALGNNIRTKTDKCIDSINKGHKKDVLALGKEIVAMMRELRPKVTLAPLQAKMDAPIAALDSSLDALNAAKAGADHVVAVERPLMEARTAALAGVYISEFQELLEKVPMFRNTDAAFRVKLLEGSQVEVFESKDMNIVSAGESGSTMYFIAQGEVTVCTSSGAKVGSLVPGEHFGEAAFISDSPRNATITTTEKTSCVTLSKKVLVDAMSGYAGYMEKICANYNTEIEEIEAERTALRAQFEESLQLEGVDDAAPTPRAAS